MKKSMFRGSRAVSAYIFPWACCSMAWLSFTFPAFPQTTNYDFNLQVASPVYTLALQPDGKILVGSIGSPLRLQTNGTLDPTFDPQLAVNRFNPYSNAYSPGTCYSIASQEDGKILIGGRFTSVSGQPHTNLVRFNIDGSLDTNFNSHADGEVLSLSFDDEGRKLVGGAFVKLGGQPRAGLGRLNANDLTDGSFNPGDSNGIPFSLAVQSDGQILAGGFFTSLAGHASTNLGRLNPDGSFDSSFQPLGLLNETECFAGSADGKIIAGTTVSNVDGLMTNLVRFRSDGSVDHGFNPAPNSAVVSVAVQTDGKIIVGGGFTSLGGQPRMGLGRINVDGSLDTNFVPIAYHRIFSLALQQDGNLLVGGELVDGSGRTNSYIGRLQNTSGATQSLTYDGSTITWLRGGTSPEIWGATFLNSTNGSDWVRLGQGTRISGGWQLNSVDVLAGSLIRAQGRVSVGQFNGTSWFVESILRLPAAALKIISDNSNFGFRSNRFGFDFVGPTNSTIVVESSQDLSSWTPLATNTIESSSIYFSDSAMAPRSFYRLRLLH
jgi:uncharacterized delta-60 repeat protein